VGGVLLQEAGGLSPPLLPWQAPRMWESYANKSGSSGVTHYSISASSISVRFRKGATYTYSHASCGAEVVGTMKTLARGGAGLSAYIARNKPEYARRG
jgi:hypothetical protein